jgi:hypothetical protein
MRTKEEICYDLGGFYFLSDQTLKRLVEVLLVLPDDAYEFAANRIFFIDGSDSCHIPLRMFKKTKITDMVIILDDKLLTIAHEIAHAFLGHRTGIEREVDKEYTQKQEDEANELAKKWLKT